MQQPRRVLIFSFAYFPDLIGGAEVAVKEITDRLDATEYTFDLIALRVGMLPVEKIGNVNVIRVGWKQKKMTGPLGYLYKLAYIPLATLKAILLHRKLPYDIIWSIMANFSSAPWLFFSYVYPKVERKLNLQEGDAIDHIKKQVKYVSYFFKKVFTRAQWIQVISNYLGQFARDMGATCPIAVIPNAVDVARFSYTYSSVELEGLREELGISRDSTLLITTSRLVVKNGIEQIISALEFLESSVQLLILGTGPLEESLRDLVVRKGVADRVHFLGHVSQTDLPKYLKASDIFVRPSVSEGMGISFIEAMAAKIPVIATPVGGIVDFLHDGETGLMCEVGNPRSLAQKVEKLMKDRESRDYIVRTAYDMVIAKYDWKMVAAQMGEWLALK